MKQDLRVVVSIPWAMTIDYLALNQIASVLDMLAAYDPAIVAEVQECATNVCWRGQVGNWRKSFTEAA